MNTTNKPPTGITDPLVTREITALLKYAFERGVDQECSLTKPLYMAVEELQAATHSLESGNADPEAQAKLDTLRAQITCLYSKLAKLTSPVTGRTLIQTDEKFERAVLPLKLWTLFFLLLAVGNEVLKAWLADAPEPEEGWLLELINFRRYVLDYCAPFFWGALGSMAYLLKRLSDVAEERTFDYSISHGWAARIYLGAMLGGIVQVIYDPSAFGSGQSGFKMSANALGFLTGVGVKVVYGAIEKTIDTLANKMNLDAIRTTKGNTASIREYLANQLASADKDREPERRKLLLAMLNDVQDPKKPE